MARGERRPVGTGRPWIAPECAAPAGPVRAGEAASVGEDELRKARDRRRERAGTCGGGSRSRRPWRS